MVIWYGIWYMVYGIWYMVYGIWYMVYGIWYMVYGIWYMAYGTYLVPCPHYHAQQSTPTCLYQVSGTGQCLLPVRSALGPQPAGNAPMLHMPCSSVYTYARSQMHSYSQSCRQTKGTEGDLDYTYGTHVYAWLPYLCQHVGHSPLDLCSHLPFQSCLDAILIAVGGRQYQNVSAPCPVSKPADSPEYDYLEAFLVKCLKLLRHLLTEEPPVMFIQREHCFALGPDKCAILLCYHIGLSA